MRDGAVKLRGDERHEVRAEAGGARHPEIRRSPLCQRLRGNAYALDPLPQRLDLGVQRARVGRRHDAALHALEQAQPGAPLGDRQQFAYRRLGNIQYLHRTAHGAGVHHGTENFHMAKVHTHRITKS